MENKSILHSKVERCVLLSVINMTNLISTFNYLNILYSQFIKRSYLIVFGNVIRKKCAGDILYLISTLTYECQSDELNHFNEVSFYSTTKIWIRVLHNHLSNAIIYLKGYTSAFILQLYTSKKCALKLYQ